METISLDEVYRILTMFGSSFSLIFLLGFQSQLVRDKKAALAFLSSSAIGALQLLIYKTSNSAGLIESIAYILGGSFGISTSIYSYSAFSKIITKDKDE
jgi:hypothetical protein